MHHETTEFSFVLKPSRHGVGVFATHPIGRDTALRLFGDLNPRRRLTRAEVPDQLVGFCADRGDTLICPPDFGFMPIGWYLNHATDPNAEPRGGYSETGYRFFAIRDIDPGEEITINYNSLEEPDRTKADYYRND
jgi:hypothetical protein